MGNSRDSDDKVPEINNVKNIYLQDVVGNKEDTPDGTSLVSLLKFINQEALVIKLSLLGNERAYGAAISPDGEIHVADGLNTTLTGFEIDAGNLVWGNWVQILGSNDTPITEGSGKFTIHRIQTIANQRGADYFWQLSFGESGDAGIAANEFVEEILPFKIVNEAHVFDVRKQPYDVGTKVWARCRVPGQVDGTLKFYYSLIEFPI